MKYYDVKAELNNDSIFFSGEVECGEALLALGRRLGRQYPNPDAASDWRAFTERSTATVHGRHPSGKPKHNYHLDVHPAADYSSPVAIPMMNIGTLIAISLAARQAIDTHINSFIDFLPVDTNVGRLFVLYPNKSVQGHVDIVESIGARYSRSSERITSVVLPCITGNHQGVFVLAEFPWHHLIFDEKVYRAFIHAGIDGLSFRECPSE